jgi:hypothetical protein
MQNKQVELLIFGRNFSIQQINSHPMNFGGKT